MLLKRGAIALLMASSAVLFAVTGCGGGGGGGDTTKTYPLSTRLRVLQPGDSFTYKGSGNVKSGNNTTPFTVDLTTSYTTTNVANKSVFAQASAITFRINGQNFADNNTFYLSQDGTTRDVYTLGFLDNNTARFANKPEVSVPGTFGQGVAFTNTLTYTNGDAEQQSFTVVKSETVSVPAGRFETWRCTETSNDGDIVTNETTWYAPQIGELIKGEVVQTVNSTGETYTYNAELTSTNVPLQ